MVMAAAVITEEVVVQMVAPVEVEVVILTQHYVVPCFIHRAEIQI
jgi:hypothetical protein